MSGKIFLCAVWQWLVVWQLVVKLALPIIAAMHDFWFFKAIPKLQLYALLSLQVYSFTIEISGPTFWFVTFLIGEYLVLFNHGFQERRRTNRLHGATCDIPQRACGARSSHLFIIALLIAAKICSLTNFVGELSKSAIDNGSPFALHARSFLSVEVFTDLPSASLHESTFIVLGIT